MSQAPGKIDEDLTRKVAELARLEVSDAEVKLFTSQLGDILSYITQLSEVDVGTGDREIQPLIQPIELSTPLRQDVARAFGVDEQGNPRVMKSAPEVMDGGYQVPPVL
ncbi:MAG: Asp-tRNA(Asn)/Glu-tRNA(Gln) amidotransferase subunit GatC [Methylotenera sp.]|nr:Asp-tRNA(Asn)/Glu-tRNA(Gln) amidotransferase subunit GatC [Oligoflexia bacterium]